MATKDLMLPDLFKNNRDSYGALATHNNERLRQILGAILLDTETGIESLNSRGGFDARNVALYDVIDRGGDSIVALYQYRVAYKRKSSYFTEVTKTYYLALIRKNEHGVLVLDREVEMGDGFTSNKILATLRGGVSPLQRLSSDTYAETGEGRALHRYIGMMDAPAPAPTEQSTEEAEDHEAQEA